jgi:Protein of unknwon function (DUF3310)
MDRITYDGTNVIDVINFSGSTGAVPVISGSNFRFILQPDNLMICIGDSIVKNNGIIEVSYLVASDAIDHPSHYGGDATYEAIKVIEAWDCGFHLGNCLKYISRAGKKNDELEDLKKAQWYLERKIKQLEKL